MSYALRTWLALLVTRSERACVTHIAPAPQGRPEVHKNKYVTNAAAYKLPAVLAAAAKGMQCFDCGYYAATNDDIPRSFDCLHLFDHYINHGQFEGRSFRCAPASRGANGCVGVLGCAASPCSHHAVYSPLW
jgi:hypothetical protein